MTNFFKLYFTYFSKNIESIFFTFIFPILMLFLLGPLMPAQFILPGLMLLPAISVAFFFTPRALFAWRKSSLIKRMGIIPLTNFQFIMAVLFTNVIVSLIGGIFVLTFAALFSETTSYFQSLEMSVYYYSSTPDAPVIITETVNQKGALQWGAINYGLMFVSLINVILVTTTTGIFLGMFLKTDGAAFALGMTLYFLTTFLGGVFFDISMVSEIPPLEYTSYALPWAWATKGFVAASSWDYAITANLYVEGVFTSTETIDYWQSDSKTVLDKEILTYVGLGAGFGLTALSSGVMAKNLSFSKVK